MTDVLNISLLDMAVRLSQWEILQIIERWSPKAAGFVTAMLEKLERGESLTTRQEAYLRRLYEVTWDFRGSGQTGYGDLDRHWGYETDQDRDEWGVNLCPRVPWDEFI